MKKKGMSSQERLEYKRLQRRKKRQLKRQQRKAADINDLEQQGTDKKQRFREARRRRKERSILGNILLFLQAFVSILLMGMIMILNVVPFKYLAALAGCLVVLWGIGYLSQKKRKKKGTGGKIYIFLVTVLLMFATFYIGKMTGALEQITNRNKKVNTMVVAVLVDDPAEKLEDIADYTVGVQYEMHGEDVEKTMEHINEKLDVYVETKEYKSVNEQAKALHEKKVKAIVYNEGYREILEEEFHGYSDKIKIIYKYDIETELKDLTIDVEVKKEPFSVYVSGIDVYGNISKTSRSDVNIIATVNPQTHQILLVTTPRDYYIEIPGVSKGRKDKLTHAGLYGVDTSIRTLSELYETEIPFYARVNFTSLIEIVDKLGGVDVYSEYAFKTGTESGAVVRVSKGMNHFNGKEALAFSRERHNLPDGDNQRGKNQQAVITGMIKKMVSPSMLIKANGIIDSVSGNMETNMSKGQMQSLIKMQLNQGGAWKIYSVAAEGTGAKAECYSSGSTLLYVTKPDEESVEHIKELIQKVENGEIIEDSETTE